MKKPAIRIVLVNTTHPGNIGGVARAMKNMGLADLWLVAPTHFPAEEANWRAVAASDVLESAQVVDTLAEAIGDCQLVIGTSARGRRIPWPVLDPRHCAEQAMTAAAREERVAFVFGREDRGLTNEELQQCNLHLHIPTHEDYTSLNLAMAVQIVAYELRMQVVSGELPDDACADWDEPFSTAAAMEHYYEHLEQTLTEIGFLDPAAPRQLMPRLRRLYGRLRLDEMEMNILRGILTETQKSIRH
jgi:tRNA (cytidine32/uridine32-2'-O)-methyltransferase